MIVAALEIENYKQYAGSHRIEFPDQGIVAVTGPNGAGKTTLFEAIEWCLYCPRAIPQSSVPPHDGVGRTLVRVTLEDPGDGKRYCVERELRSGGTQAEIYLDDESQPIVQGTREVTRYVARHLIGLSHGAFVSTFFTRQKELQFFADRSATERRTEVGRLLGLEAVREAQREIGEGRTVARALAESLRDEHARRLDDRDLAKERERAFGALQEAEALDVENERVSACATTDAETARAALECLRERQAQDAQLGHAFAELGGGAREAAARRDSAVEALIRLDTRAAERVELATRASAVERLAAQVSIHLLESERAQRLRTHQEALQTALDRTTDIACRLEAVVLEHREAAVGIAGWAWGDTDRRDVPLAVARLHGAAAALDPEACRNRVESLQSALRAFEVVCEVDAKLAKYTKLKHQLTCEREQLLAAGDPDLALRQALAAVRETRQEEQKLQMALAAARVEREDDERVAEGLRQHAGDPECPTCTRPLGDKEAKRLIHLLETKIGILISQERELNSEITPAAQRLVGAEQAEAATRERLEHLRTLTQRLADGQKLIDEETARHALAAKALQESLDVIGADRLPTADEIAAARLVAERTQQLAGMTSLLSRLSDDAMASHDARERADLAIRELGEVQYDAAAHQEASAELDMARRAAAQLEQIDVELASRRRYERQRDKEEQTLAAVAAQRAAVESKRQALAFEPSALQDAAVAEQAARSAAHEAREQHAAARQAVRDARMALERLESDHAQLQNLITSADASTREADELTRMYDEFGDFDRYVARHVGPLLAETTERMLSQVTNGKYDHVQFDENYGIEVFDGDEAFPLSGFSGGERDVVALCARLALSEIVGSAALRPPRFLVLDEVFGSLDSERRVQLLDTLGSIANSGHFRQMFIISHIDDVQQSPVMNEAWTVEERDGVSRVVRAESALPAFP